MQREESDSAIKKREGGIFGGELRLSTGKKLLRGGTPRQGEKAFRGGGSLGGIDATPWQRGRGHSIKKKERRASPQLRGEKETNRLLWRKPGKHEKGGLRSSGKGVQGKLKPVPRKEKAFMGKQKTDG